MKRKDFLKKSMALGGALWFGPSMAHVNLPLFGLTTQDLKKRLIQGNDDHVRALLSQGDAANRHGNRSLGYNFAKFAASYCQPESTYFHQTILIEKLSETVERLFAILRPDGTINAGNLESPPDTAFIMEPLCSGVYILLQDKQPALDPVKKSIQSFIEKVGQALTTGGVHTPNHRWEICSALAWVNALYPNPKYVQRIDEWLSEGIYIDEDGHYPERSMNYADVENRAFLTIGRHLKRPELFKPVAKSLEMTYYYMEPNGDLVTFDSRRQDQYSFKTIMGQYLHYRYLAITQKNPTFSAIASLIEKQTDFESQIVNESLFHFMANSALFDPLPTPKAPSTQFTKVFKTSSLARIRRDDTTVTIFGGNDWPLIIASGRSVSPNFFAYRRGDAILKYMRMSSRFFSMGFFRSEGLNVQGNTYTLHKKLEAPYYQPLPAKLRNSKGDYELTPSTDDRFWSKMAFDKRPQSNVKTLDSRVEIKETNGEVSLDFHVTGQEGVEVTIHLCFDEQGTLEGVKSARGADQDYFLEDGYGIFRQGKDQITFGPGIKKHEFIRGLEGEKYSVHFGNLRTPGHHVYLTGVTPFHYTLKFS